MANYCYYYDYGNIAKNCIRKIFRDKSKSWMNGILFFYSCHMIVHVRKNYKAWAPTPSNEKRKGKGKVDGEKIRNEMNQAKRKKEVERNNITNEAKVTLPKGLVYHTTSN